MLTIYKDVEYENCAFMFRFAYTDLSDILLLARLTTSMLRVFNPYETAETCAIYYQQIIEKTKTLPKKKRLVLFFNPKVQGRSHQIHGFEVIIHEYNKDDEKKEDDKL